MPVHYIDFNNKFVPENEAMLPASNRGLRYGDGIFETMRWMDGDIRFLDHHVKRLQEVMHLLQLVAPQPFDAAFFRSKAAALIKRNNLNGQHVRIRFQV